MRPRVQHDVQHDNDDDIAVVGGVILVCHHHHYCASEVAQNDGWPHRARTDATRMKADVRWWCCCKNSSNISGRALRTIYG